MAGLNELAREAGLNPVLDAKSNRKVPTTEQLEELFRLILARIARGEKVQIRGLGVFYGKQGRGGLLKSPLLPGGEINYKPRLTMKFRISSAAKDTLNQLLEEVEEAEEE